MGWGCSVALPPTRVILPGGGVASLRAGKNPSEEARLRPGGEEHPALLPSPTQAVVRSFLGKAWR